MYVHVWKVGDRFRNTKHYKQTPVGEEGIVISLLHNSIEQEVMVQYDSSEVRRYYIEHGFREGIIRKTAANMEYIGPRPPEPIPDPVPEIKTEESLWSLPKTW